jgi:hypothetical protein
LNDFFTEIEIRLKPKISEEIECVFGVVEKILMRKELMEFIW